MKIREAVPADIPAIVALNAEVHEIHVRLFPEVFEPTDPAALSDWYRDWLDDESTMILLAEEGSEVVAYLTLSKLERPAHLFVKERKCAYIDQVCVTERHRGKGIFRTLLAEASDVARKWGMSRLELDVWSQNVAAKNAFLHAGLQTYFERMKLLIDD